MATYATPVLLETLSAHTDAFLQKAVSEWQMLSHEQLTQAPAPGSWSANQCLAHLNQYGRYYLPRIEEAIDRAIAAKQEPALILKAGWLGNYFTELMLVTNEGKPKKKMSAPRSYSPLNHTASYIVVAEFVEQQEKLLLLLRKAKQVDLGRVRIPISIAKFIRLKLGDVLLFLIAHNYRHILQADRALQKATNKEASKLNLFLLGEMQA